MSCKQFFIVLDTETCNTIEHPLPYDIGWVVCDRQGNIYTEKSFIVAETFLDMKDVMQSAYYANKIPNYWEDIKAGKRKIKGFWNIRKEFINDIKKYNIKKVGVYNMGFDKRALNNLIRYTSKSWARWFFPYGIDFFCIWNMACTSILNRPSYIKFAEKNNFISEVGNIQTSAECAYRYITKNADFIESHTGLEDVKIEVAIMAKCYSLHKPFEKNINSACWRKVQRAKKEKDLKRAFGQSERSFDAPGDSNTRSRIKIF